MASELAFIIGQDGEILQIIGKAAAILGVVEQRLIGTHVMRLFHDRSQGNAASLMRLAPVEKNLELGQLALRHPPTNGFMMFEAHSHALGRGTWRLELDRVKPAAETPEIVNGDNYITKLTAVLGDRAVRHKHLVLIDIAALREPEGEAIKVNLETEMQDHALHGQVGRLGAGSYGVLPDSKLAQADLLPSLYRVSQQHGVMHPGIQSHVTDLSDGPVQPGQLRKALGHLMHRFLTAFDKGGLPASLADVGREMEENFALVSGALAAGRLQLKRQPVIDLSTGRRQMEFILGHVLIDGSATLAANMLLLDDYPELALQHDLGMAALTISHIADKTQETPDAMMLEISASTIANRRFEPEINSLLAGYGLPHGLLGFALPGMELGRSGAAETAALMHLLRGGHPIWLTQFAAAVGSTADIKGLGGAFVEAPGKYLRRMCESQDGNALVRQLLARWRDANVHVVATGSEDAHLRQFLLQLGVRYGLPKAA